MSEGAPRPLDYAPPDLVAGRPLSSALGPLLSAARRRPFTALSTCFGCLGVALYLAAAMFGRGGRGFFSPDTLECRTQGEWLLPLTEVPLYRGPWTYHRYRLVDYLVAEGHWAKSDRPDPRWLPLFKWNQQWRDGHTTLYRQFGQNGDRWIDWSKRNPETARVLWPKVLAALRRGDAAGHLEAEGLLIEAEYTRSLEQFNALVAEFAEPAPGD